ncbi:7334_t:CDS:1, partial [Dentiscutata erythropus]
RIPRDRESSWFKKLNQKDMKELLENHELVSPNTFIWQKDKEKKLNWIIIEDEDMGKVSRQHGEFRKVMYWVKDDATNQLSRYKKCIKHDTIYRNIKCTFKKDAEKIYLIKVDLKKIWHGSIEKFKNKLEHKRQILGVRPFLSNARTQFQYELESVFGESEVWIREESGNFMNKVRNRSMFLMVDIIIVRNNINREISEPVAVIKEADNR